MAVIDKDGVNQVNQHVKNALVSIYDKLSVSDPKAFALIKDEFDHMMTFVNTVGSDWQRPGGDQVPRVTIDNIPYSPAE